MKAPPVFHSEDRRGLFIIYQDGTFRYWLDM